PPAQGFSHPATPSPQPPAVLPNTVHVRVLNGSGSNGVAGQVGAQLAGAGFNVAGTGDADSFHYSQSVVRYGTGQQAKAAQLQGMLTTGADVRPDPTLRGVDVV